MEAYRPPTGFTHWGFSSWPVRLQLWPLVGCLGFGAQPFEGSLPSHQAMEFGHFGRGITITPVREMTSPFFKGVFFPGKLRWFTWKSPIGRWKSSEPNTSTTLGSIHFPGCRSLNHELFFAYLIPWCGLNFLRNSGDLTRKAFPVGYYSCHLLNLH